MSRLDAIADWVERAKLVRYDANELAKLCLISPVHLRRYFKRVFRKPAQRWLSDLRRCHAMRLLGSGRPVKVVASELHFADEAHFCHHFKRHHGIAPLEFVLRHRRQANEQRALLTETFGPNFDPALLPPPPWEEMEMDLCQRLRSVP